MDAVVTAIVLFSCTCGLLFALLYTYHTSLIRIGGGSKAGILHGAGNEDALAKVVQISKAISDGAQAFLWAEYGYMAKFVFLFSILLAVCLGLLHNWSSAAFSVIAFVSGATTSVVCGYIGMMIATYTNSRTAVAAMDGWGPPFVTAFKGGVVMGFALTSLGILVLYILICCFNLYFTNAYTDAAVTQQMYECIAGYGLGGSSVALFGRVGGGIYTKAADVGADLCKIEHKMDEDSPQNPAVIADNVGDNVGDIAGMGADLFGSFAESSCACMVIASQSPELFSSYSAMSFPLVLASVGIIACIFTSFFATHIMVVKSEPEIEQSLKRQIMVSTVIMTPIVWFVTQKFLPPTFTIGIKVVHNWHVFYCICMGLWSGMIIGYVTEYFTSNSYAPTRQVANACNTGAATNIIYGLALGYKSVIVPVFCLAATIYVGYSFAGMFGVGVAALGILSTMSIGLTIDAYGPICDNAGGIAEMAGMGADIRVRTDALDAAGNTTAAIGKGFAIGSAALVSLALFGAFITTVGLQDVDILQPFEFSGLLVGAMLPYWFSAMTMKSVGKAALAMVLEVREQFLQNPKLLDPHSGALPDYQRCIAISTRASLNEMIPPGALVMLTPVIVGFLFGVDALAGVLAGSLVSGVQMAISASNSGGAWDNAKKYIEKGNLGPDKAKGSEVHDASVIGDTVGDPLKDTSGPALNILIKLSAIISLVFAPSFPSPAKGGYLQQLISPS